MQDNSDLNKIKEYILRINDVINSYSSIIKQDQIKKHKLSDIIRNTINFSEFKFKRHDIEVINSVSYINQQDEPLIKLPKQFVLGCLTNIIDNSLYWMDRQTGDKVKNKKLYFGMTDEFEIGPAIVIADNGPGFRGLTPEEMTQPFFTSKPDGMGLGLYFVSSIMKMLGGDILFFNSDNFEKITIPKDIDGAIVALVFKK